MDYQEPTPQNRWYDQDEAVSKSVTLLGTFPPEIQGIIADGIVRLADRECNANELMENLRSLGPDKVLGIFKSKNRRRSYDSNHTIHQAMNYLYILSDENRMLIAERVIELVNFIYSYLKTCKTLERPAQMDEVGELTHAFVDSGIEAARQMLAEIQIRIDQSVTQAEQELREKLTYGNEGLRIRDERKS